MYKFIPFLLFGASAFGQVSITVSSQGTKAMKTISGYSSPSATLVSLDVCSEGEEANVSSGRIRKELSLKEGYSFYTYDVVSDVLGILQDKDKFIRVQRAVLAGVTTATIVAAVFKNINPVVIGAIQAAPAIAQAVLPAVGTPRDLLDLEKQLMQDNSSLALGKKGAGNDCQTKLVVAMTGEVKIDTVVIP